MRHIICGIGLCLCLCACEKQPATESHTHIPLEAEPIRYQIQWIDTASVPSIQVNFSFEAEEDSNTQLVYTNQDWGESDLMDAIVNFSSQDSGVSIRMNRDSNWLNVSHPKNQRINISYTLQQDFQDTISYERCFRPIIQDQYFHIFGRGLFAIPRSLETDTFEVNIEWQNFPEYWVIHNSFNSGKQQQHLYATAEELRYSMFVGGDFRVYDFWVKEKPVYFAIRGKWPTFSDSTVFRILQKAVKTQRKFWNDYSDEYFSVTLIPTYAPWNEEYQHSSIGGEGLTNSFSSYASNNEGLDTGLVAWVYHHELMHHWIGQTILIEEMQAMWFSEGFTEYFAYKNLLLSGEIDIESYIRILNEDFFQFHYQSPVKEAPDRLISQNFWTDKAYEKLPYKRGCIFAFCLDMQIKRASGHEKSLKNVMQDLLEEAQQGKPQFTEERFIEIVNPYLERDMKPFFRKHIIAGRLIEFEEEDLVEYIERDFQSRIPQFRWIGGEEELEKWVR